MTILRRLLCEIEFTSYNSQRRKRISQMLPLVMTPTDDNGQMLKISNIGKSGNNMNIPISLKNN